MSATQGDAHGTEYRRHVFQYPFRGEVLVVQRLSVSLSRIECLQQPRTTSRTLSLRSAVFQYPFRGSNVCNVPAFCSFAQRADGPFSIPFADRMSATKLWVTREGAPLGKSFS